MLKILYLTNEDMRKEGGGKTHFIEVAQNLVKLGNELLVLLPGYWPRDKRDYGLNIRYVPTFKKNSLSYLLYEFLNVFYFGFYILKFKPDAIYSRSGLLDVMPPILARLFRVLYVIEKNGIMEDEFRSRGFSELIIKILRLVERINFRLSSKIVCVTEGIKQEIARRYRVDERKLLVIPNGANTKLFRPLDEKECRRRLGLEEDAFYVGFVGSFSPWQGLETLIEAAKQVKGHGLSEIKYLLVGDGELEPILRRKVREDGLEGEMQFTGRVAYEEIVYYMNAFNVAVAPFTTKGSEALGSPLKIYEYLACGRPVLASRVDGVKEVIEEGRCGYLFESGDAKELAEKILQSYHERDSLAELGRNGRRLVEEKYNWRETARQVVDVLQEAIAIKSRQAKVN